MSTECLSKKTQYTWSREATLLLINLYEQFPCLYITTLPEYHNKNKRHRGLEDITTEFNKKTLANLTLQDIQKKIHGIRTQYLNELNKIKKSIASGASTEDVYVPKLWCFDFLQFLRPSGEVVSEGESNWTETNMKDMDSQVIEEIIIESENDTEIFEEELVEHDMSKTPSVKMNACRNTRNECQTPSASKYKPPTKKMKRADKIENILDNATRTLSALNENTTQTSEVESSNVLFGKTIAAELNTITDEDMLDELKENIYCLIMRTKKRCRQSRTDQ